MIEDEAVILQACGNSRHSVRQLVNRVAMNSNKTVNLLKSLEDSGLLIFETEASGGRPRKIAVVTELGAEFLSTFNKLQKSRLLINNNEVQRVTKQVERVRRLEAMGVDLQKRMLEMADFGRLLSEHQQDRRRP